jgi:hypothetical protein
MDLLESVTSGVDLLRALNDALNQEENGDDYD